MPLSVDVLCVFVFFFFKQKTAYEMRISDWSSDVCSSDLHGGGQGHLEIRDTGAGAGKEDRTHEQRAAQAGDRLHRQWRIGFTDRPVEKEIEIGRASCRERVCQYV